MRFFINCTICRGFPTICVSRLDATATPVAGFGGCSGERREDAGGTDASKVSAATESRLPQ